MKKLILFGDSLLAGYIDGHATNIVTQGLQEKLPNFTIINNSVPGSTTEEAIDFYDLRIKPFNYDLVILALGTNDANMQFGLSAGRYAHNLQVLVDLIGVDKTILMGPSSFSLFSAASVVCPASSVSFSSGSSSIIS